MRLAGTLVWAVASVYLLVLFARMVLGWVMAFSRGWRPSGILAAGAEIIFTVTDPPLKLASRVVPSLRLGGVALDMGFMVVVIVVSLITYIGAAVAAW